MSQSALAARRMETGAEAAKGWEGFRCEQRIERSWRILFTMAILVEPIPGRARGGCALKRQKAESRKLSACGRQTRRIGDGDAILGAAVHLFLAGLPYVDRALEPGPVLNRNS